MWRSVYKYFFMYDIKLKKWLSFWFFTRNERHLIEWPERKRVTWQDPLLWGEVKGEKKDEWRLEMLWITQDLLSLLSHFSSEMVKYPSRNGKMGLKVWLGREGESEWVAGTCNMIDERRNISDLQHQWGPNNEPPSPLFGSSSASVSNVWRESEWWLLARRGKGKQEMEYYSLLPFPIPLSLPHFK